MNCKNNEFEDGNPIDPITREIITTRYKLGKMCYNIETIKNILIKGNRINPFTAELIPKEVYDELNINFR